jgi:hypothetical protein
MTFDALVDRPFRSILEDAVMFARQAETIGESNFHHRAACGRAVVFFSMALLECAANACLAALHLTGKFDDEIDRLPMIAKFDLYARLSRTHKVLDRGRLETQKIQELKKLRDALTHPRERILRLVAEAPNVQAITSPWLPLLRVSESAHDWTSQDIATLLQSATDFLNFYFTDLCMLAPTEVAEVLLEALVSSATTLQNMAPSWGRRLAVGSVIGSSCQPGFSWRRRSLTHRRATSPQEPTTRRLLARRPSRRTSFDSIPL